MVRARARRELRQFYTECADAYETGFLQLSRVYQHATYEAYRAGWTARKNDGSSTMPPDVFVRCFAAWCR